MAQSPDNLFRIDPREVKAVAPVSELTAATSSGDTLDTSISDRSRAKGFGDLGQQLLAAGAQKKRDQIAFDVRTAQEAGAREESMPGGLYPIAQRAYRDAIDINTSHSAILAAKDWLAGDEFTNNVVKNKGLVGRQKTDQLKNHLAELKKKALATIQNPTTILNLNGAFDELVSTNEKVINEFEKDNRDLTIIETGTNVMLEATSFAKRVGGDNIWKTVFTPRLLENMYKDILKIAPDMGATNEHKILAFKVMTNNPDMLGKPTLMRSLLDTEYSKGISFKTLLIKGSTRNRLGKIDNDANQFAAVWEEYERNSTSYFASIERNNKSAKAHRNQYINEQLIDLAEQGGTTDDAKAILKSNGVDDLGDYTKWKNEFKNYAEGENFSKESDQGREFEKSILGGKYTEAEIKLGMMKWNISLDDFDYFKSVASVEMTQVKAVRKTFDESIKEVQSRAASLLKGALSSGDLMLPDGKINKRALREALFKEGLDSEQVLSVLQGLQDITSEFDVRASRASSKAAKEDNFSIGAEVNQFQDAYYDKIETFIKNIKEGNLNPGTPTVGGGTKTGLTPEKKPDPVVDHHKKLLGDKTTYIEEQMKEIEDAYKSSTGEQSKRQLSTPVYKLNATDEAYLEELKKDMSSAALQRYTKSLDIQQQGRTLTGDDIFDLVTKGEVTDAPSRPQVDSRTGLGPAVDDIDSAVGSVIDWFKDKPQASYEVQSTISYLDIFSGKSETGEDETILSEDSDSVVDESSDTVGKASKSPTELANLKASGATSSKEGVNLEVVSSEVLSVSKYLFEDKTLLKNLPGLEFESKVITSAFRRDNRDSAHGHGEALDIRMRNLDNVGTGEVVTRSIHSSLKRGGYTILKTQDNKDFFTTNGQVWTRFTKDGKEFMMEIDTKSDHLHIQQGDDFETTRDIAKQW